MVSFVCCSVVLAGCVCFCSLRLQCCCFSLLFYFAGFARCFAAVCCASLLLLFCFCCVRCSAVVLAVVLCPSGVFVSVSFVFVCYAAARCLVAGFACVCPLLC